VRRRIQRRKIRVLRSSLLAGAFLALVVSREAAAQTPNVEQVIGDFGFPANASERLRRGEVLEADPAESSDRELAVGLTFLVKEPPATVAKAFRKAVDLQEDSQLAASMPLRGAGALADFATLVLAPDGAAEAKRYVSARPGETLNLSPDEIRAFDALATASDQPVRQVEDQLRQMLLARYRSYLASGLDGIPPYARSGGLLEPSKELRGALEAAAPLLGNYAPAMLQALRTYPRDKPADLKESFYWLRYDLDGRPNYTLRHRLALPVGSTAVVADREFYVSHGYNTSQAISGLIPVPEGTVVFYRSRVSTDQVAGFGSSVKKGIGRGVMAKQLMEIFKRSRASFQQH
jgi:hypothetical protein